MDLVIRHRNVSPGRNEVEIVERKGLGHPDTLCDAIAEAVSIRLCKHYLEHFGVILHHNVDKVLLCSGSSRPAFGGGEILEPIEIYLGGRAANDFRGTRIPTHEIAIAACREVLHERVPALDLDRHIRVISRLRPGSTDLTQLFGRNAGIALANDTSCGVGFAPLTDLERVVLAVERRLNSTETKRAHPAIGSDIKVMGIRRREQIALTIGCAFIGRHIASMNEYERSKETARASALRTIREITAAEADATINAADDVAAGNVYLTVLGTSAEAGDDGEVGRGNRANGLITPYRPMTMEAAAGKNPVSHVGKLYNVVADRIATALVAQIPVVRAAACVLVSQIGHPIDDPQVTDVRLELTSGASVEHVGSRADDVARAELARIAELRKEFVAGRVTLF